MHLALALSDAGWHPAAWREPTARAGELFTARYWVDQVREAQSGRLDFVTIEDSFRLQSTRADGPDDRTDQVRGRLDAVLIAARVAPVTQHIGIVPAATTTLTEPFRVSTQIATLDYVSRGRAGWHVQISTRQGDRGYVGPRTIPRPEALFDEAADHVEVVRRLWGQLGGRRRDPRRRHRTVHRSRPASLHRFRGSLLRRQGAVDHPAAATGPADRDDHRAQRHGR